MDNQVVIIGTGCTEKPGKMHIDKSFKQLLVESCYKAIVNANISPSDIDGASFSYLGEGEVKHGGIAPTLIDTLGLSPIPAFINSANCASAHVAFLQGCDMIKSGKYNMVLVAGFDKCTDILTYQDYTLLSTDTLYDYNLGFSHVDAFALGTKYFYDNKIPQDITVKSLLKFATLARKNAYYNPIATFYKKNIPTPDELMSETFLGNIMSVGEGASAVILTNKEYSKKFCTKPILVEGTGFVNNSHYLGHIYNSRLLKKIINNYNSSLTNGLPLKLACEKAYKEANISPKDIDTIQVYDQLANAFISLEASGICSTGEAPEFIISGKGDINGECPINTDGGNIARGHAGGAASLYQIIEIVNQLKGCASGTQITSSATYGLSTVIGGYYATAVAVILSNRLFN